MMWVADCAAVESRTLALAEQITFTTQAVPPKGTEESIDPKECDFRDHRLIYRTLLLLGFVNVALSPRRTA